MKPIELRQRGRQWEVWLNVDEAVRRVRSRRTAEQLVEKYGRGTFVPIAKQPDGKFGLAIDGKPARLTKDRASGFAHQIGRYLLDLGDFVYTYVDEQREQRTKPEGRDAKRRHASDPDERPAEITRVAREIYDHTDKDQLLKDVERLGWRFVEANRYSGAWWIRKGDHEVMITFGGPRQTARAFSWRPVGGAATRI